MTSGPIGAGVKSAEKTHRPQADTAIATTTMPHAAHHRTGDDGVWVKGATAAMRWSSGASTEADMHSP
jgi:hypothetical protein